MMEHLEELESKIQDRRPRTHQTNNYSGQIISIEELYEDECLEPGATHDEEGLEDEFGVSHSVNACYAQVNMTGTKCRNTPWFLDSGSSHHVSGEKEVFTSMRASRGTCITTAGGQGHSVTGILP